MIEITLKFATVALAAAALNQLNGSQLATAVVTDTEAAAPAGAAGKLKAEKPAIVAVAKTEGVASMPSAAPAPTVALISSSVDYPTLQKAVFNLVGLVKAADLDPVEHVLSIAKKFGYDNFKAMKDAGPAGAAHFDGAMAAITAKTEELSALVT